jgi:hypothetical protein
MIVRDCQPGTETFDSTRARTDRTWWLLAPNPFVVLADAAPALPEQRPDVDGNVGYVEGQSAGDLDPARRHRAGRCATCASRRPALRAVLPARAPRPRRTHGPQAVWPTGLAANVLLGIAPWC